MKLGIPPNSVHQNSDRDYQANMSEMSKAWFGAIRNDIAENLPTKAKFELQQRVFFTFNYLLKLIFTSDAQTDFLRIGC